MSNAPCDAELTRRAASSTPNIGSLTSTASCAAAAVDERQFAVVAIVAHQAIDFGERRERLVDGHPAGRARRRQMPAPGRRCPSRSGIRGFRNLSGPRRRSRGRAGSSGEWRRVRARVCNDDGGSARRWPTCSRSRRSARHSRPTSLRALPASASCRPPGCRRRRTPCTGRRGDPAAMAERSRIHRRRAPPRSIDDEDERARRREHHGSVLREQLGDLLAVTSRPRCRSSPCG